MSGDRASLEREATYVEWLARSIAASPPRVRSRPHYDHMLALLADLALQAAINYETVVMPRVQRILREYREFGSTSAILELMECHDASVILQWRHHEKLGRFTALLELFAAHNLQTPEQLRGWAQSTDAVPALLAIRGVGPKSVDYALWLCGHDVIPVDRHVVRFLRIAGVSEFDYGRASEVLATAAHQLTWTNRQLERVIWATMRAMPQATPIASP